MYRLLVICNRQCEDGCGMYRLLVICNTCAYFNATWSAAMDGNRQCGNINSAAMDSAVWLHSVIDQSGRIKVYTLYMAHGPPAPAPHHTWRSGSAY
jgi:hypothetical protein